MWIWIYASYSRYESCNGQVPLRNWRLCLLVFLQHFCISCTIFVCDIPWHMQDKFLTNMFSHLFRWTQTMQWLFKMFTYYVPGILFDCYQIFQNSKKMNIYYLKTLFFLKNMFWPRFKEILNSRKGNSRCVFRRLCFHYNLFFLINN